MSVSLCSCIARKSEDRREEIMEIDLMNEALVLLRIHPTWKKQEARRKRTVLLARALHKPVTQYKHQKNHQSGKVHSICVSCAKTRQSFVSIFG